eukprot:511377-Alexandrium_andersonii.AAC.1
MHGPAGLLLASCHRFGFRMDAHFVIRATGERAINILKHPAQQVKPFFLEAIARATCARAMSRRSTISCASEVDWKLNARIQARMPGPDRTLARRVKCL